MAVSQPLEYPKAEKGDVVDDYFGTKVPDPYRWLEDTDSPETVAWVKAENILTSAYMEKLPDRAGVPRRIDEAFELSSDTPCRTGRAIVTSIERMMGCKIRA